MGTAAETAEAMVLDAAFIAALPALRAHKVAADDPSSEMAVGKPEARLQTTRLKVVGLAAGPATDVARHT